MPSMNHVRTAELHRRHNDDALRRAALEAEFYRLEAERRAEELRISTSYNSYDPNVDSYSYDAGSSYNNSYTPGYGNDY